MKRLVKLAAIAAVVVAALSALKRRPAPPSASPTAPPSRPGPVEAPVVPTEVVEAVEAPDPSTTGSAEPTDDGGCPDGFPVKAKSSSKIFHVPGGVLYDKTVPDRCYASAEAAEADGFRRSLR